MPTKLKMHLGLVVLTGLFLFTALPAFGAQEKQTQQQFIDDVRKNFEEEKFDELDSAAYLARESKERFPGAEWKLYIFYRTLTAPRSGAKATDQEWTIHIERLKKWADKTSDSMTARVALGAAWAEYAKKAYTSAEDWMNAEGKIGGKEFQRRMTQAKKALEFDPIKLTTAFFRRVKREYSTKTGTELKSYCPHWYVVRLTIEQAHPWEWGRYDNIFGQGVALEPTYYYLYQTKAADLLPVPLGHGTKGQWEAFADNSARSIGGKEGEITYYMIVSHLRRFFDTSLSQGNFFRDNLISGTRLLEGHKQIEATYGTSNVRQNEMALMASMAKQYAMAKVFFDEIGENWEPTVWRHKSEFDGYKALVTAKAPRAPATGVISEPYGTTPVVQTDLSGLKAKVSSRQTSFAKSQDVVIEVVIENPSASAYGLSLAALSLAILDVTKRQSEVTLLPQSNDALATAKVIKPGETVSLSYRVNFALKPGEYKIKMKSVASNELAIKIGAAIAAPRR